MTICRQFVYILSTICLQFVFNLSTICPNFVLVLSEFCHNKNKTKQRQMTNCRQIVGNLSFVFVLSCFCIQFVICLYFVLFLLWQNSDKTKKKLRQIVDKLSPNCRQIVDKLSFVFVCSQGIKNFETSSFLEKIATNDNEEIWREMSFPRWTEKQNCAQINLEIMFTHLTKEIEGPFSP